MIRFLYGRPLETLLATWGISLILQQAVRTAFGPTNREVGAPAFMSGAFELGRLAMQKKAPLFSQADADQNGTLSAEEYQQLQTLRQAHQARMNANTPDFKTLDSNSDGQLSHDELRSGMQQQMQKMNAEPTTK